MFQKLRKAKNRVQRRAQFVAHAGEELALRAVGPLGFFFRLLERRRHAIALRGIALKADEVRHLPVSSRIGEMCQATMKSLPSLR